MTSSSFDPDAGGFVDLTISPKAQKAIHPDVKKLESVDV